MALVTIGRWPAGQRTVGRIAAVVAVNDPLPAGGLLAWVGSWPPWMWVLGLWRAAPGQVRMVCAG